jgi:carboxyl-terminal processing protease
MERSTGLRNFHLCLLLLFFLSVGLVGGVYLDRHILAAFAPLDNIPSEAEPNFRLMAEAWNIIHKSYVGRAAVKPKELTYGSISGMVEALGDTGHSGFLPPEMVSAQRDFTQGRLKGIGAQVQMKSGNIVIVAPMDGSPAEKAGLRPGDIILKVDGQDISGLSLTRAVTRILGPVGTQVTLTILTPATGHTRELTLTRQVIVIRNVTWRRISGTQTAHLRIAAFSDKVTEEMRMALTEIEQAGLEKVILDLRNNPGGLLNEAIGVASLFLEEGNVLMVKDADGKSTPTPVLPDAVATGIPLIALVNGGTASASEIVAGALQDNQRATLVGEKTFGTGTVLNILDLSDGSALMLAVEEWLTPKGNTIWHKGIPPDVAIPLPADTAPLFPEAIRHMTPAQLHASGDVQLLRAMELLGKE